MGLGLRGSHSLDDVHDMGDCCGELARASRQCEVRGLVDVRERSEDDTLKGE